MPRWNGRDGDGLEARGGARRRRLDLDRRSLRLRGRVASLTPAPDPSAADGVVVLTGGSDLRLEAAARLLQAGKGERLLVSGVNRRATRADVWGVLGGTKGLFDCCVDLGFNAADTIGNARETAQWARDLGYRRLILVTADYHMPRATLELRAAMPGERIIPYPVGTPTLDARRWTTDTLSARRMIIEYCKYLAVLGQTALPPALDGWRSRSA